MDLMALCNANESRPHPVDTDRPEVKHYLSSFALMNRLRRNLQS
jgi:hypothetical protein